MTPTPPPIISTPLTRLRAFFSEFGKFLGEMADILAGWSWWRVIGLSLLLLIAGAMLDDFFVPERSQKKFSQSITIDNGKTSESKDGQIRIKVGGAEVVVSRDDKKAVKTDSKTEPKTTPDLPSSDTTKTEAQLKEAVVAADAARDKADAALEKSNEAREIAKQAAREAARAVADVTGNDDEETAELEANLEKIIKEVLTKVNTGKTPVIQVETTDKTRDDRAEPFKSLAAFFIMSSFILKLIGGSRLREKVATTRATIATESAEAQSLQRQIAEAKLLRMQAQVEPHFLFNTLAALERLIEVNPTRALAMSQALSQWLRALLPQMKEGQSTLGNESNLVQSYLQLMQMRMGERLAFFIDIPETLRAEQIPSMLLQPLVENSIKHGLESKKQGGEVRIKARKNDNWLELVVEDTGVGFAANPNTGNGLSNLRERLELIYNGKAMVSITPRGALNFATDATEALTGTVITIKLPVLKN